MQSTVFGAMFVIVIIPGIMKVKTFITSCGAFVWLHYTMAGTKIMPSRRSPVCQAHKLPCARLDPPQSAPPSRLPAPAALPPPRKHHMQCRCGHAHVH